MFQDLKKRLSDILGGLSQRGVLREADIDKALREIRIALLEADVSLPIIQQLLSNIRPEALGQEVAKSLTPGQVMIKIVHDHLVKLLSHQDGASLNMAAVPPVVVLMVGLQGSGKTTTSAKLAQWLTTKEGKKVLLTSVDVYRPAAREQLIQLGQRHHLEIAAFMDDTAPRTIAHKAQQKAQSEGYDVLIVDTAGRLQIDEPLMNELVELKDLLSPQEILFVADAMMGQESARIAETFHNQLAITGSILSRTDGDARGGAALSIGAMTGQPLKFIGTGEHIGDLEVFDPKRQVGRILGQGDIVSFVEEVQSHTTQEDMEDVARKMQTGTFSLQDLEKQLSQMQRVGSFEKLMGFLPGMDRLTQAMPSSVDDDTAKKELAHQLAVIRAMTPHEKRYPKILNASRKRRIAQGSGRQVPDVNRLLKQFEQMEKMMKRFKKLGKKGMMRQGLQGLLPPGMKP